MWQVKDTHIVRPNRLGLTGSDCGILSQIQKGSLFVVKVKTAILYSVCLLPLVRLPMLAILGYEAVAIIGRNHLDLVVFQH